MYLESPEAARRLGVKLTTLYAYVSRGLLASEPSPDGRRRRFRLEDVEGLARRSQGGRHVETRLVTVMTSITALDPVRGPLYRGAAATDLARTSTFEAVAERLWGRGGRILGGAGPRPSRRPRPGRPPPLDGDHVRGERPPSPRPAAAGRPACCGPADPRSRGRRGRGGRLGGGRASRGPSGRGRRTVGAAAQGGGDRAHRPRRPRTGDLDAGRPDGGLDSRQRLRLGSGRPGRARRAAARRRRGGRRAPHSEAGESAPAPRSTARCGRVRSPASAIPCTPGATLDGLSFATKRWRSLRARENRAVIGDIEALVRERALPAPNVDMGLASLVWAAGGPPAACEVVFAVARSAGWVAHHLEELGETPLRFRARAVSVGAGDPGLEGPADPVRNPESVV